MSERKLGIFFKTKEGEKYKHMNTLEYFEDYNFRLTQRLGKITVFGRALFTERFPFEHLRSTNTMEKQMNSNDILENLKLLSDWLRVKYPGDHFELIIVGGAAMALNGFKEQTKDIDLLRPEVLPTPLENGIARIARAKRLSPQWLNTNAANIMLGFKRTVQLPDYFNEISQTIEVGENLKINLIGRQALISLKMFAATPAYRKHTNDLMNLRPNKGEIIEAVRFVLSIDGSDLRRDDLQIVIREIGFDFDEIIQEHAK